MPVRSFGDEPLEPTGHHARPLVPAIQYKEGRALAQLNSGSRFREVSLDSDPLDEEDQNTREFRRIMVDLPTPAIERRLSTITRNGNVVRRQAR